MPRRWRISSKTNRCIRSLRGQVLWIDEAGLLSARQMRGIFQLAEKQDCRVILSGDTAQHTSVERGDALRLLETYAGLKAAQLTEIRRQKRRAIPGCGSRIGQG
jgi:ATP-dependent exoDNAse (exonuclease V) alpha subunit